MQWEHPYDPRVTVRPPITLIRPYVSLPGRFVSTWDVTVTGVSGSGTFYTSWVDITGGIPRACGWFMFPEFTLGVSACGRADVYLDIGSGGTAIETGKQLGSLWTSGTTGDYGYRAGGALLLVGLDSSKLMRQIRWKIVATTQATWSQSSTTMYKLT